MRSCAPSKGEGLLQLQASSCSRTLARDSTSSSAAVLAMMLQLQVGMEPEAQGNMLFSTCKEPHHRCTKRTWVDDGVCQPAVHQVFLRHALPHQYLAVANAVERVVGLCDPHAADEHHLPHAVLRGQVNLAALPNPVHLLGLQEWMHSKATWWWGGSAAACLAGGDRHRSPTSGASSIDGHDAAALWTRPHLLPRLVVPLRGIIGVACGPHLGHSGGEDDQVGAARQLFLP